MAKILGLLLAALFFALIPAALLFFQYNLAVALAYLALSLTLLSIFWGITDIRDEIRQMANHVGEPTVTDSRHAA